MCMVDGDAVVAFDEEEGAERLGVNLWHAKITVPVILRYGALVRICIF